MEGNGTETHGESQEPPPETPSNCPSKAYPLNPSSPSKLKDGGAAGTKVKRKTRRKLNAMVSNASLHFSDTDSEGELTTITPAGRAARYFPEVSHQAPTIAVTAEGNEEKTESPNSRPTDENGKDSLLRCNNFVESLTDVDEIYASETENETRENKITIGGGGGGGGGDCLNVDENGCSAETDLEEIDDEEVQSIVFVKPRSDIFCEYSGETITTKEGDGPFSVQVRNRIYLEEAFDRRLRRGNTPEIVAVPIDTDEEEMTVSDEELAEEACFNQKEIYEDLDVLLAASQIVVRNVNKTDTNLLNVKDVSDEAISDCHTDVEDVEQVE